MDYDVELLKLYFRENDFNQADKQNLLDSNPFNRDYVIWENKTKRKNKLIADVLKKNKLITSDTKIQEIVVHENNDVGRFLSNDIEYSICHSDENINKIKPRNKLILIHDIFKGQEFFLEKLSLKKIPFIVGVCDDNYTYYKKSIRFLNNLKNNIKGLQLFKKEENNIHICIAKKM